MLRPLRPAQLAFDVIAPSVIFLICFIPYAFLGASNLVLLAAMCAALAFRRLQPGIALGIAWVGALVQMASNLDPDPSNLAILVVLYGTAAYGTPLVRWLGLGSAIGGGVIAAGYTVLRPTFGLPFGSSDLETLLNASVFALVGFLAVLVLPWTFGLLHRSVARGRETNRARLAAEQAAVVEQERTRIARDMHDVVAHSLAVVIAQADGARYLRKTDPDAVDGALEAIAATARNALGDVRVLLAQLRHSQAEGPQPTLADLDALIDSMRASGLPILLERSGDEAALPAGHQLALYRITQEALTNALRHGDPSVEVRVHLDWHGGFVVLRVSNALAAGTPTVAPTPGHGLAGMRERALLTGGTFSAGQVGSRFEVEARLPAPVAVAA